MSRHAHPLQPPLPQPNRSKSPGSSHGECVCLLGQRFGWTVQLWVSALMLLNMGIGITAEYTAMGDLFEFVIGTTRVPIVIIVGVIASIYTAYGGLYVSIITDQVQVTNDLSPAKAGAPTGLGQGCPNILDLRDAAYERPSHTGGRTAMLCFSWALMG